MSQHADTNRNIRLGLCHNTLTINRTPRLGLCHNTLTGTPRPGLSQHTDTNRNSKTWAVSQHTDTNRNTKTWAVSQHTDTNRNTKVTLKCYALHSYEGTIFSHDKSLHNSIHPPEMEIYPLKMVCGCPCGRVIGEKMVIQTCNLHRMECTCQCSIAYTG